MINFFNSTCSEEPRTNHQFGLCDDETNNDKAYSNVNNERLWIATVENQRQLEIQFTAIDHCMNILKPDSNDLESTCDGMLTFSESVYLIELKNQRSEWTKAAIEQLENTIKLMYRHNSRNLSSFKFKKAYACNKRRPRFTVIDTERKKRFYDRTGFRLDIQANIVIS